MKKFFTLAIVLLPLISIYASGIRGFSLGDVLLIVLLIVSVFTKKDILSAKSREKNFYLFMFVLSIFFITLVSIGIHTDVDLYDVLIRIIRRTFYYLFIVFVSTHFFDYSLGQSYICSIGKYSAVFLVFQYIFYFLFGFILLGFIPFIPIYHEIYSELDYQNLYENMFRPSSFFLEPAHFARFLIIPLIFFVFEYKSKWDIVWGVILSIVILLSTSGIGVLLFVLVCFFVLLNKSSKKKYSFIKGVLYLLPFIITFLVLRDSLAKESIDRVLNSDLSETNTAGGARFRGYYQFLELSSLDKIIGMGYGAVPDTELVTWFSGAGYLLYGVGILGFLICMFLFYKTFLLSDSVTQKYLCIVFFFLLFVDDNFMSNLSILFFSFIFAERKQDTTETISPQNVMVTS